MILVARGLPDQQGAEGLAAIEQRELASMRKIIATKHRDPLGDEVNGYQVATPLLWDRQGRKCAYCESSEQRRRNDAEHYRPKGAANRGPAHAQTHGYWWLAWRWENLLFSCRNCNQPLKGGYGKGVHFPLEPGSGVLVAEQDPHGADAGVEKPLLIDPAAESGIDHIEFRRLVVGGRERWRPSARAGSAKGDCTIRICGLDRDDLVDLYQQHVDERVRPRAALFDDLHPHTAAETYRATWTRTEHELYRLGMPYVGLSYDALRFLVPDSDLAAHSITRRTPR